MRAVTYYMRRPITLMLLYAEITQRAAAFRFTLLLFISPQPRRRFRC